MKFSIIVVSLNPGERLKQTIQSIERQSFQDYEVVVKDGGSKDDSIRWLKEYLTEEERVCNGFSARVKIYEQKDQSIYDAMNQAIKKCSGQYYLFLNCGDLFHSEEVLEEFAKVMDASKGDGAQVFYGTRFSLLSGTEEFPAPVIDDFTCFRNIPCHQTCFYGAELFSERGYNLKYVVRADYEHFLWCYYRAHASFTYVPVCVADYEGGGFSETKENVKRSAKEHKEITGMYLPRKKLWKYRAYMLLTLQGVRHQIATNPATAKLYQGMVKTFYKR